MEQLKKVIITGGTGLIGSKLKEKLQNQYDVFVVSRTSSEHDNKRIVWSDDEKLLEVINGAYAVVHLAGASIASWPWTKKHEQKIYDSRVLLTQKLTRIINQVQQKPEALIQISAIGIYPSTCRNIQENASFEKKNFIQNLVVDWEQASAELDSKVRKVILRVGLVLSPDGGALKLLMMPFRFRAGGHIGSGLQYVSWIHIEDMISLIDYTLSHSLAGVYNTVSPNPVKMKGLVKEIGRVKGQASWLHMPAWAAKLVLGKLANYLLLVDQEVSANKISKQGFIYKYEKLDKALRNLIS